LTSLSRRQTNTIDYWVTWHSSNAGIKQLVYR